MSSIDGIRRRAHSQRKPEPQLVSECIFDLHREPFSGFGEYSVLLRIDGQPGGKMQLCQSALSYAAIPSWENRLLHHPGPASPMVKRQQGARTNDNFDAREEADVRDVG